MTEIRLIGVGGDTSLMSAEQKALFDKIASGPRGGVPVPFLAMMDQPRLAEAIQAVGAEIRFASSLSDAQRELAILTTASSVGCGYEWNYHCPLARKAGISDETIDAARGQPEIADIDEMHRLIIEMCRSIVREHSATTELMRDSVACVGREGTMELIAIAGYYSLLANFIKAAGMDEPFH